MLSFNLQKVKHKKTKSKRKQPRLVSVSLKEHLELSTEETETKGGRKRERGEERGRAFPQTTIQKLNKNKFL